MIHYSDEAIIEGLRLRSDFIIRYIYHSAYPMIKYLVLSNSGNEEDAEDLFQDALIIIYKKIKVHSLELNSSFHTYFYSVSRYLWLQKLTERKINRVELTEMENFEVLAESEVSIWHTDDKDKMRLYRHHFFSLNPDCQKVLLMFMEKMSLKQIAEKMGYKSGNYAKTRKYLCKEELKKKIINDPMCHKFLSDD
ncbi:MAG: sigma-70 family RNA polymerase sigma factor [Lentimicrobiaceae bacterium]|nr:sigma-70 family RNA polymerase sigma factor [Lentimicrobiaceae bacterium]